MHRFRLAGGAAALALLVLALGAGLAGGAAADAARVSLRVVALAVLLSVAFGLPLAWALARWRSPLRPFVEAALLSPVVLPPTVTGFVLASLVEEAGPLGFLGLEGTWQGAALAAAVVSYPLFLRAARTAFSGVDSRWTGLARALGRGRWQALLSVTLPMAGPGLVAGAALAMGRALGEFGASRMVAGSIPGQTRTLAQAVYDAWQGGDAQAAQGLALLLLGACVLFVGAAAFLERERPASSDRSRRAPGPHPAGTSRPSGGAPPSESSLPTETGAPAPTPPANGPTPRAKESAPPANGPTELRLEGLQGRGIGPVDLDLPSGGHCVILGPSGAGKSSLLALLAGLAPAQGGRVLLGGVDLLRLPPERRGIGYVPQGGWLFPHLDVAENVAFGLPRAERHRVEQLLEAVGAAALAHRDVRSLSGGETMRVAIARALAVRPRLLLLDEPLAGLDPGARAALVDLLGSLPGRLEGLSILHVTHDFDEACVLGSWLAILLQGRIAAAGAPERIFAGPPSPEIADFLQIDNVLAGNFVATSRDLSTFRIGSLELQLAGAWQGAGWISFAGSDVLLTRAPPPASSSRNALVGQVVRATPVQHGLLVTVRCADVDLHARLTRAAAVDLAVAPGQEVGVLIKATAPHVVLSRSLPPPLHATA